MYKYERHITEINDYGFTIIRNVLNKKTINSIKIDIKKVLIQSLLNLCTEKEISNFKNKNIDFLYNYLKTKSPQLKSHCYDVLSKLAVLTNSINNDKLYKIAQTYLKGALIINTTQLRIDDPSDDRVLPWHQELEQMSLITLNVWLPLTKISKKSGGLSVIPKSHKKGLQEHIVNKKLSSYFSLSQSLIDKDKSSSLFLNAGDALMFHSFLFHKSTNNISNKNRWTIVFRYNQLETMPYLKSPKAKMYMNRNPKENEPGNNFLKKFKF